MKTILLLLFFLTNSPMQLLAAASVPLTSTECAVLITLENGATGSGFFIGSSNLFFLATAGHVLFSKNSTNLICNKATISWHSNDGTNNYENSIRINLGLLQS